MLARYTMLQAIGYLLSVVLGNLFSVQYENTAGELFQDDLVPCVYCGDDFLSIFQRKILLNQRIQ